MTRTSFTFLVHPRTRTGEDLARVWRPLGRVPEKVYDTALRRLPLPPVTIAAVEVGGEQVGHVVLVPFGARHLLQAPAEGRARVARAVDRAVALGSGVVGLGALTATVTAGGASLREPHGHRRHERQRLHRGRPSSARPATPSTASSPPEGVGSPSSAPPAASAPP